jgi:DNA-binding transcriptional ArsR family regulator
MSNHEHDGEVLRRLIRIDHKTESMEDSLAWIVSANAPQLKDELIQAIGTSVRRVQVYLALDGKRNVRDLTKHLGMKQPNVSRDIAWLKGKRLIDVIEAGNGGTKYDKKFFDAIVGLSGALMKKFKLDANGKKLK